MIYVLLGETCSGKTTMLKRLKKLGYEALVSYTTRPRREHEVDGKDYYFISDKQYQHLSDFNLLAAKFTAKNNWSYGINVQDIDVEKDFLVIVEPRGFEDLLRRLGSENITSIYIKIPLFTRLCRGINRKDDVNELVRRLRSDEHDFIGLEDKVDFVLDTEEEEELLEYILQIVDGKE